MSHDRVTRLRQLMSEAVPAIAIKSANECDAWRVFQVYDAECIPPTLEQSWQERSIRKINRLAIWYGLAREVQRAIDDANVHSISALCDEDLIRLQERMEQLEGCIQTGCGAPDAPPAS